MTLAPLLHANAVNQIHAFVAFTAIGLGAAQLMLPKGWEPFSPIHLPYCGWPAYRGHMRGHGKHMTYNYVFALIVAGIFTFAPGRIMHAVLFGS